jgi:hypothetical protein
MSDKLNIANEMRVFDRKDRTFYDNLTEEERKKFSNYLMIRWGSSVEGSRELQEFYVVATNERLNKHFFDIGRHPKLQWLSLVACSYGKGETYFHEWIPLKKEKNKKEEFLAELFPNMKRADVETLAAITTDSEIKEYCQGLGWDKKQINAIKL